jgi:hypothetical protein
MPSTQMASWVSPGASGAASGAFFSDTVPLATCSLGAPFRCFCCASAPLGSKCISSEEVARCEGAVCFWRAMKQLKYGDGDSDSSKKTGKMGNALDRSRQATTAQMQKRGN